MVGVCADDCGVGCGHCGGWRPLPPKGEDSGVSGRGPSGISGAFGLMASGGGFCTPAVFGCTRGAFGCG